MSTAENSDSQTGDLDLSGLKCPLPVLKARKALRAFDDGTEVRVRVTDPKAPADFRALCDTVGHELLTVVNEPSGHLLTMRVHRP